MAHALLHLMLFPLGLALCLVAAADHVKETCMQAGGQRDFCAEVLTLDGSSRETEMHDRATTALQRAYQNASAAAAHVEQRLEKHIGDTELQECLIHCFDEYTDAVEQLVDAQPALAEREYGEVSEWVQAAEAGVKACQEGCSAVLPDELSKKNADVRELCGSILSIVRDLIA